MGSAKSNGRVGKYLVGAVKQVLLWLKARLLILGVGGWWYKASKMVQRSWVTSG
jgi:hypothetical protein